MSVNDPEIVIDWDDPDAVEAALGNELRDIEGEFGYEQEAMNALDCDLEYKNNKGSFEVFYKGIKVAVVKYDNKDKYIEFIGTINGKDKAPNDAISSTYSNHFQKSPEYKIIGLGYYTMGLFFGKIGEKGDVYMMRIENPKIREILTQLQDDGIISSFGDIPGVPPQTEINI